MPARVSLPALAGAVAPRARHRQTERRERPGGGLRDERKRLMGFCSRGGTQSKAEQSGGQGNSGRALRGAGAGSRGRLGPGCQDQSPLLRAGPPGARASRLCAPSPHLRNGAPLGRHLGLQEGKRTRSFQQRLACSEGWPILRLGDGRCCWMLPDAGSLRL